MNEFRKYNNAANNISQENAAVESIFSETEYNNVIAATLISIYTNSFLIARFFEAYPIISADPTWYNSKLKSTVEDMFSAIKTMQSNIYKDSVKRFKWEYVIGITDMCDSVDEDAIESYNQLIVAIRNVFENEYGIKDHVKELSIIYALRSMVTVAKDISVYVSPELSKADNRIQRILSINTLDERSIKMCAKAECRIPDSTPRINLNKQLTVRSKFNTLRNKFKDTEIFKKAFDASHMAG